MSPKSNTYLRVTNDVRVFSNCIFNYNQNTSTRIAQLKPGDYHLENGFLYTFINVYGTWKLINQTLTINNTNPYYV